jgi:predicted dehydrogenase
MAKLAREAARRRRLEHGESGWGRAVAPPPQLFDEGGRPRRIAVVGAGVQGRVLAQATAAVGGAELVGLADLDGDRLADAGSRLGLDEDRCFTDAAAMFASGPIDLVAVATTAPHHVAIGRAAKDAGIGRILLEKPIDTSYALAADLVASCEADGVELGVNYTRRWLPDHRAIVDAIRNGAVGAVRVITAQIGPGQLAMHGSHHVDLCRMLTGAEPVEVSAQLRTPVEANVRGDQFDDPTGHVVVRFDDGSRAYLDFEEDLPKGDPVVTIRGDHGLIGIEEHHQLWTLRSRSTRRWTFPFAEDFRPVPMTARMLAGMFTDQSVACSGTDGLAALEVILAAHHSSRDGGRIVSLPLDAAHRSLVVNFP